MSPFAKITVIVDNQQSRFAGILMSSCANCTITIEIKGEEHHINQLQ